MSEYSKLNLFIVIKDENDMNVLFLNKNDLCNLSDFFRKLCEWNFSLKTINLNVTNCQICSEILLSELNHGYCMNDFNPNTKSYNIVNLYESYDYFGINFDLNFFLTIKFQERQFEDLFNVIDKIGYNNTTIKSLVYNLPSDYDLTKIPKKLLEEMYKLSLNYDIICHNNKDVKNLYSKYLSKTNKNYHMQTTIKIDFYGLSLKKFDLIAYCTTTNKLAIYCANKKKIKIYEAFTMKKIAFFFCNYTVLSMYFSSQGNYIVIRSFKLGFFPQYVHIIYNLNSKETFYSPMFLLKGCNIVSPDETSKICIVKCNNNDNYKLYNKDINSYFNKKYSCYELRVEELVNIKNITYSSKGKFIAIIKSKEIIIFDDSMMIKQTFIFDDWITDCCFSPNDKYIVIGLNCGIIKIFDVEKNKLIKNIKPQKLYTDKCFISNIKFTENGKYILFVINKLGVLEIWDFNDLLHLETLHFDNINFSITFLHLISIENNLSKKLKLYCS
ncbi:putative BTB/POZ domain-containing protein [Acanthamoeba polyphaga mimivirus]|uniref:BTB/POZ domain-containing protein n=1 Tax=Acanthamoeba polyphaga mimivirus Kroon TaxID=3069720 RepID=A0A0G2Y9J2_9VIRU|nr:putative BTB/POZ domain-containing protein [Acanthamoeba polyphaga mimivirus]AKI79781.1 putative BTB/POZ domain-containing protein [Acanthamoeba polyphaga mimivirus Kroon]